MANLTVDEAITKVRQFLDDTSAVAGSRRWSEAQVRDALADQLSVCLNKYALEGGDRFDLEGTATTSATDGSVSVASLTPLLIKQVAVVVGNTCYRLPPKSSLRRGTADLSARSLRILYVKDYALSSTGSHPLIGVGSAEANSWRAFDLWVCWCTAVQLSSKDMEPPRQKWTAEQAARAEIAALSRAAMPLGYPMPRPEWSPMFDNVSWQLVQPLPTIYLSRVRW